MSGHAWEPARDGPTAHRVVIGVDFSSASLAAARWTAHHSCPRRLVLVHVVEVPKMPAYLRGVAFAADRMANRATAMMRVALAALADALGSVRCAIEVRSGRPAEQLHMVAEEHEADLLVIGRTGKRARGVKQLGSTVERLLRRSAKPVMVAAGALSASPRRILAAVDEGELARMCSSGRGEWRHEPDPRAPVQSPRCTSRAMRCRSILAREEVMRRRWRG